MISAMMPQGQQLFHAQVFEDQVTTNSLAQNIVYATGTMGALIVVAGIMLVDLGGVRRVNMMEAIIQKMIGFFIGVAIYFGIGYSIWNAQYYAASGTPNAMWASIQDWWLGGSLANSAAQNVDPAVWPLLNNGQIFIFFLSVFAGLINVLLHFSFTERIKPAAYYIICAVTAVVSSVVSWLTWGSAGPLTNLGFHDYFGVGFVYVFTGAMALVLARKIGARHGMFEPHPEIAEYRENNLGLTSTGLLFVFAGLPMVILSCGYFVDPDAMFVSVTMADTSIGLAFNNLALSWAGGALVGAVIAYRTRSYINVLFGPLAGYVACAAGFDVYSPWQTFLVAMGAPIVSYLVYEAMQRAKIDEHKLVPVLFGAGAYGLIMVGLIGWGTPRSGYVGVEEGPYAFQHASVNVGWQLLGLAVIVAIAMVTAWVTATVCQRTVGLRVSEQVEVQGYDFSYWQKVHDFDPVPGIHTELRVMADGDPVKTNGSQTEDVESGSSTDDEPASSKENDAETAETSGSEEEAGEPVPAGDTASAESGSSDEASSERRSD